MKRNIRAWALVGGIGGCFVAWPSVGHSQNVYFNAEAGAALADQVDLKQFFGPTGGTKLKFDTGVRLGASGGFNFNQFLGIEAETGFIYNSVKSASGGGELDASLSHVPMMLNVVLRYDQPNFKLVPYVGAGIGGDLSVIDLDNVSGNGVVADGADAVLVFAWQAFAGVRYRFNEKMSFGVGYKYYSADSATWDFAGYNNSIKIGPASVNSFLIEFNMKF